MFTQEEWRQKLTRQAELESYSTLMGRERFERRLKQAKEKNRGSRVGAGRTLLKRAVEPTRKAIEYTLEQRKGKPGRPPSWIPWITEVGTDVAAYLTAQAVLNKFDSEPEVRLMSLRVSRMILHELRYRRLRKEAPGLFEYRMSRFDTTSYAHRSRSLDAAIRYAEVDISDLTMSESVRLKLGVFLIGHFMAATGLCRISEDRDPDGKIRKRVVPTEDAQLWISKRNDFLAELHPVKMPMVVPPLPWRKGDRGGYRFRLRGQDPLVRERLQDRSAGLTELENRHMPVVYNTLNRLQDTAWEINPDVFSLLQEVEDRGGGVMEVPPMDNVPEPGIHYALATLKAEDPGRFGAVELRPDEDGKLRFAGPDPEAVEEARSYYRHELGQVRDENYYRGLDRKRHSDLMLSARELAEEDAFFFVYNLDFRGRIYPVTDRLSPQGRDVERGLLRFADKRPMGALGGKWLAIHMVNMLDDLPGGAKASQMTLIERQRWVEDHEDEILAIAQDPWRNRWWMEQADHPFQFYAACCEWARWAESGYDPEFESGLPVAMDGTANGLQHFSAMFRDSEGARAVNVAANERPQDVYHRVAQKVADLIEKDFERGVPGLEDEEAAMLWLTSGLIDRSLTKRPTMTVGYGSKRWGFTDQILSYLDDDCDTERVFDHFAPLAGENDVDRRGAAARAATYMSQAIWRSLSDTVEKAFEAMQWLQDVARAITRSGNEVRWEVPGTGFPVIQPYYKAKRRSVRTILAGEMFYPRYMDYTDDPDPNRQANGIAPNVIHSLDAAVLMRTVVAASDEGIEAFSMVHDSYATVPGDAELLSDVLRQEFWQFYSQQDVVAELFEQWREQTDEELPTPPEKGGFKLQEVLVSDYFFS